MEQKVRAVFDKSKWKTVVEKHGNIIVVHFTGGGEEYDKDALEEILDEASGYSDNAQAWFAAVGRMAEEQDFELPEEWYCCGIYDYSVWQKRFAEICAESIVPELEKLLGV